MIRALAHVTADQLTARLHELRRQERHLLVELLAYVGEVDRRRLYLELGYPSLWAFLTQHLGYASSSAGRRCIAARLMARFPVVAEYLEDGRLRLTTLVELRDVLDEAHLDEILARAAGRTEDDVKRLVAALRPQPPVPDLLRRLPAPRAAGATGAAGTAAAAPAAPAPPPPAPPPPATPGRVTPLSATQHLLRATVSDAFVRDLDEVRAALSHKLPGGSLEAVLHECLRVTLAACEMKRRGTGKAIPTAANQNESRYVPAAIRDEVWRRDQGRCTFVGSTGHVCASAHQLELHHLVPFARGGAATVANLALRCRVHNRYEAELDFGRAHVEQAIARSRPDPCQASLF